MDDILFTSLIRLIACPGEHAGRTVSVIGFCVLAFEGKALYVSELDHRAAITKNALWLDVTLTPEYKKLSGTVVLVEGVFDPTNMGHLRMYSGSITNVTRMQTWGDSAPNP
jgi:hypothetical protein